MTALPIFGTFSVIPLISWPYSYGVAYPTVSGILTVEAPALTPRQLDVLGRLCRGLPNKLVCRELNLSENTVKEHITTIYRILDVRSRTQAVIKASQLGLQFPP